MIDGDLIHNHEFNVPASLKILTGDIDSRPPLRIGSRLDKYRIVKRLGEGGFATVFAAQDLVEDRKVALKIPEIGYLSDSTTLDDLQREVRIMARMDHPCILALKDARFIDGHFVMAFPLGDETLSDRMGRRMSRTTAIDLIVQMISAVGYAHEKKVLHRDLKPDNIFVTVEGHAKVLDFGLAKLTEVAAPAGSELSKSPTMFGTVAGQVMGTAGYMAPEQVNGEDLDQRADLFAFG